MASSSPKNPSPSDSKAATAAAAAAAAEKSKETQKPNKALEEDDEFEDFPAEGWLFSHLPIHQQPPQVFPESLQLLIMVFARLVGC